MSSVPVESVAGPGDLEKFMAEYDIAESCKFAKKQLIDGDVRAAVGERSGGVAASLAAVSNTTHHFITVLDLLELELTSVDEVLPGIQDLMREINSLGAAFPPDWIGRTICTNWHAKLMVSTPSSRIDPSLAYISSQPC